MRRNCQLCDDLPDSSCPGALPDPSPHPSAGIVARKTARPLRAGDSFALELVARTGGDAEQQKYALTVWRFTLTWDPSVLELQGGQEYSALFNRPGTSTRSYASRQELAALATGLAYGTSEDAVTNQDSLSLANVTFVVKSSDDCNGACTLQLTTDAFVNGGTFTCVTPQAEEVQGAERWQEKEAHVCQEAAGALLFGKPLPGAVDSTEPLCKARDACLA